MFQDPVNWQEFFKDVCNDSRLILNPKEKAILGVLCGLKEGDTIQREELAKREGVPSDVPAAVTKLRDKLERHWPVTIGHNYYRMMHKSDDEAAHPKTSPSRPRSVECLHLGDAHAALRYVMNQYPILETGMGSQPVSPPVVSSAVRHLVKVRDTHVRSEEEPVESMQYRPEAYLELQQRFHKFLEQGEANTIRAMFVIGRIVDKKYLEKVQTAAASHHEKVRCRRLKTSAPMMNFTILDFSDGPPEVVIRMGTLHLESERRRCIFII